MHTFAIVLIVAVLVVIAMWAYFTAQRLNLLHIRTDSALQALQAALDRRAAVIAALDPEMSTAAKEAQAIALGYDRFALRAEKERALSASLAGKEQPAAIVDAEARLELAHRFYNDAVADTRALRGRPAVRMLRLGGTAKMPEFFEYTDYTAGSRETREK